MSLGHEQQIADLEQQIAKLRATTTTSTGSIVEPPKLKLDLGCGPNPKPGFEGVDCLPFDGKVKHVVNLAEPGGPQGYKPWPWADNSVDEVHCSHFVEHLKFTPEEPERIHFVNELWRVLKPDGKCEIVVPHWSTCRFWGDYTHRQPVSEFWPPYLSAKWRKTDAPHNTLYKCDFDCSMPAYQPAPDLVNRSDGYRELALKHGRETIENMMFTLIARKPIRT